jgi:hypothetical protein
MSFDLAVWHSESAPSKQEAHRLYLNLCKSKAIPQERYAAVEAFYADLTSRYPEIDSLPEEALDSCPWSCAHDKSGFHVIMCMNHGDNLEEAAKFIVQLAEKHGLLCYNPQGSYVYVPQNLKPKKSEVQVLVMSTLTFENAESDFQRFAAKQGYPESLLWTRSDELVFWRGRFFVRSGDHRSRRERARALFERGATEKLGIALEAKCKTEQLTICRVFVPADDLDAQYRMIPAKGIKLTVAVNQFPTVLVESGLLFLTLRWWRQMTHPWPDWD